MAVWEENLWKKISTKKETVVPLAKREQNYISKEFIKIKDLVRKVFSFFENMRIISTIIREYAKKSPPTLKGTYMTLL